MDEEQSVLNFFAQPENLPLGLSVAELMDDIRQQLNTRYWHDLHNRVESLIVAQALPWKSVPTEDRNAPDSLVGLCCNPASEQSLYLRPMIEQQYTNGAWRIYFGLMWSSAPAPEQLALPAVNELKQVLCESGFKNNSNFLGWQWTTLHPRRKDFLLRYSQNPEAILSETMAFLNRLLIEHGNSITLANDALRTAPRSMTVTLDQLRSKRAS